MQAHTVASSIRHLPAPPRRPDCNIYPLSCLPLALSTSACPSLLLQGVAAPLRERPPPPSW